MSKFTLKTIEKILGENTFADWDENRDGRNVGKVEFYRHGTPCPNSGHGIKCVKLPQTETAQAYAAAIKREIALAGATIAQYSSTQDPLTGFFLLLVFCFAQKVRSSSQASEFRQSPAPSQGQERSTRC